MRPFALAVLFLSFLYLSLAAPTTSSSTNDASHTALAVSSSSFNSSSSSSESHSSSTSKRPTKPSHLPITRKPHSTPNIVGTRPLPLPNPTRSPNGPTLPPHHPDGPHPLHNRSGQRPIAIVFEVLGGIGVGLLLLSFLRCCNNYRKTPRRDRIADIVQRHNLQRELEELERNPRTLRRPSLPEPAPPYFPRPPSYERPPSSLHHSSSHSHRSERSVSPSLYSAVSTFSPPSSPPMSEAPLPSTAVTRRAHPQFPSG